MIVEFCKNYKGDSKYIFLLKYIYCIVVKLVEK